MHIPRSGSGRLRCRYRGQDPEGSGAEVRSGSGRLRCRYRGQDPEGSSTEVRWGSAADT